MLFYQLTTEHDRYMYMYASMIFIRFLHVSSLQAEEMERAPIELLILDDYVLLDVASQRFLTFLCWSILFSVVFLSCGYVYFLVSCPNIACLCLISLMSWFSPWINRIIKYLTAIQNGSNYLKLCCVYLRLKPSNEQNIMIEIIHGICCCFPYLKKKWIWTDFVFCIQQLGEN